MNWAEYTNAARELAELRRQEDERRGQVRERAATARGSVEQLRRRLVAQRDHLVGMAGGLREPVPSFEGVTRSGSTDLDEAIRSAWHAVEQSDVEARNAEQRAQEAAFLPGWSTTGRNAVAYTAATVLAVLASCGLWVGSDTDLGRVPLSLVPWQMCGLPAMAFFAGYLTITLFGRPRVAYGTPNRSTRLGAVICFGGLWVFWLLLVAGTRGG